MVVPTPFVAATMAGIKDKLKPHQVRAPHGRTRNLAAGSPSSASPCPAHTTPCCIMHVGTEDVSHTNCQELELTQASNPGLTHVTPAAQILVSCTKGIVNDSLETVNQVLERVLPPAFHSRLAFLSGPSFAAEVARGLPTVVTIASRTPEVALRAQALLSTSRFRCYTSDDVQGTLDTVC